MINNLVIVSIVIILSSTIGYAYIDIEKYCKAFDSNFRPIICILKNNNTNNQHRPHPSYPAPPHHQPEYPILYPIESEPPPLYGYDLEDDDCSCDMTCYPLVVGQNQTGVSYKCRSCGSSCALSTSSKSTPNCSCAVPSGNATCTCNATCATFRHGHVGHEHPYSYEDDSGSTEDTNCIFNVGRLIDRNLGAEQRPYNCECCKAKAAQDTGEPDFVCICQRVSGDRNRKMDNKTEPSDPLMLFKRD